MAKVAVSDGITVVACTPHIFPGVFENNGPEIHAAVASLQLELDREGIPLAVTGGADVHMAPDILDGLRSGLILSLGGSRYVLVEPPSGIVPPRFEDHLFGLLAAGYVPIVTHPERLRWPNSAYAIFERIVQAGVWNQVTGGSLLGDFGRRAQALAERMLMDGLVHIIASDAHGLGTRPPLLSHALAAATALIGEEEAAHLVQTRAEGILQNHGPSEMPPPRSVGARTERWPGRAMRKRLFKR